MDSNSAKEAYRKFGVFRFSEELSSHGIVSPAEQIAVVLWIVENELRGLAVQRDSEAIGWMRTKVAISILRLRAEGGVERAIETASLRSDSVREWNLDRDFAELLSFRCGADAYSRVLKRLLARGFSLDWQEMHDLATAFVATRLPRAVLSFEPVRGRGHEVEWLTSVAYRFSLAALVADRTNRIHLEALERPHEPADKPDDGLGREEEEMALEALTAALEKLPKMEQRAVRMYFGFEGREFGLREIAAKLGMSQYLARVAVVRGLAMLCAHLGLQGALDRQELEYLNLTIVEGMGTRNAAASLSLSFGQTRKLAAGIGRKLRAGLRARTVQPARTEGGKLSCHK